MDKRIRVLAGCEKLEDFKAFISEPFNPLCMMFLQELSARIKEDVSAKYSEVHAFAFFIREKNLFKIKEEYRKGDLGLGRIFHVVASNVPCLFAYSMVLSLISGNANIVRVSTRIEEQDRILIEIIRKVLDDERFYKIKENLCLVQYEKDDEITGMLLNESDGYIVFGGDDAVKGIRSLIKNPNLTEITFPDRYSVGLIDVESIGRMSDDELKNVAHRLYMDTYLVNQNACGSPRILFFLSKDGKPHEEERNRFFLALTSEIKNYKLDDDMALSKLLLMTESIMRIEDEAFVDMEDTRLMRIKLDRISRDMEDYQGRCGVFYEVPIQSLHEMTKHITPKLQTIATLGVPREDVLNALIESGVRGGRRIVLLGESLTMVDVWDGRRVYPLLTRRVI